MTKTKPLPKTPRRRSREFAVQGIYRMLLNPDESMNNIINEIRHTEAYDNALSGKKKPQVDDAFFAQILTGIAAHKMHYAKLLRPLLDRDESEVSPIEYAILFVACHELAQMPENPYPVIINEAVEICKAYGGTEGYKFINGILDKLAQELRPNDPMRLNKAQA